MHRLDPAYLPESSGKVSQFLINPHGDIDGLILDEGIEVHFPPHLSNAIGKAVKIGESVTIRGARLRLCDVIVGVTLETADGSRIIDNGPPEPSSRKSDKKVHNHDKKHDHDKKKDVCVEGVMRRALHGPKGETRGVLLEDGQAIRFPRLKEDDDRVYALKAGAKFAARGVLISSAFGAAIEAHEMGASLKKLHAIAK